jgi:Uma2 family endonuclease
VSTTEPVPDWLRRPGGYTADDLDTLLDLPPHTELIDGSLVFVSPQSRFHALALYVFERSLRREAPDSLRVEREMTVTLADQQRLEPDVLVVEASAVTGLDQTTFYPDDVVLVVEVVSRESAVRDRERKPQLYAQSGIEHFWRVENKNGTVVVYVYELDEGTHTYGLSGVHRDRLRLSVPFKIDIDLTEVARL